MAFGWLALGRENSGKSLLLILAHKFFLPQGSYLRPLWRKTRKMGNEREAGEGLNTGGECLRAWLLQSSKATEKLIDRQAGPATPNLET